MQLSLQAGCGGTGTRVNVSMLQGEDINPNGLSNLIATLPWDLTGYSFKTTIQFPTPLTLTTQNGGIVVLSITPGTPQTQIGLIITSAQTESIAPGSYPFDTWALNASNPSLNDPIFSGTISLQLSNTAVP